MKKETEAQRGILNGVTQLETPRVADPRDYNPIQQNS